VILAARINLLRLLLLLLLLPLPLTGWSCTALD
jgi:hypothetical protein